ncbi:MAG: TolC family protein [Pirellulaceae bacterium]|nr:TolC family protein [Pirellulaceae bacterium]
MVRRPDTSSIRLACWNAVPRWLRGAMLLGGLLTLAAGCAAQRSQVRSIGESGPNVPRDKLAERAGAPCAEQVAVFERLERESPVRPAAYEPDEHASGQQRALVAGGLPETLPQPAVPAGPVERLAGSPDEQLAALETQALAFNPALRRLSDEFAAARAKVNYVGQLPDPTIGANIFAYPIETAAGAQRANLQVMQMIPWLRRLDAQSQQAYFEALAVQHELRAARLRVIADLRTQWYRLFVLRKQIDANRGHARLLRTLIDVANARVSTGQASQGDVLSGTLELSGLEEQLVTLNQQLASTQAELNRILGQPADTPLAEPRQVDARLPDWSHEWLRLLAWQHQPELSAARWRARAAYWGLEIARLKRRPDFSVSAAWFVMDDNRPPSPIVDVGHDAWSVGAQMSVPLWHGKYDALEQEAARRHLASHASVDDVVQRYDAALRDLWERARAADQTARLYQDTLLPQARQTLEADQKSYSLGSVEFDRVMRDFRGLLTIELGYYRAVGELASALARIEQAVGIDLVEGRK